MEFLSSINNASEYRVNQALEAILDAIEIAPKDLLGVMYYNLAVIQVFIRIDLAVLSFFCSGKSQNAQRCHRQPAGGTR